MIRNKVYFYTGIVPLVLGAATVWGAMDKREPHIGYLFPAGAQRGSTVYIAAGGQFLRAAEDVYVSGQGVHAEMVKYYRPINNQQLPLLRERLREVRNARLKELGVNPDNLPDRGPMPGQKNKNDSPGSRPDPNEAKSAERANIAIPQHPLLEDLDNKTLRELAHIWQMLLASRRRNQTNRQLAEMVLIKISVDPAAQPGSRELRILTANGLTNPVVFQVGQLPEVREIEPNSRGEPASMPGLARILQNAKLPQEKPLDLPVVLNGQIMPGDVDRFRFHAKQGQHLVIETRARSLMPYLADAVPGWFQAVIALYDDQGHELAYDDDYRFNPDPVLSFKIPTSGEYELEIHDSLYRGRQDFVYQISISQCPFITQMFPLSARTGTPSIAVISGWNLRDDQLQLDTQESEDFIRHVVGKAGKWFSNPVAYVVDPLPQYPAKEPNNSIETAQEIDLPVMINGRIDKPGDIDVFQFTGRNGEKVTAQIYARSLNSPLDSLLRLMDKTGKVLAWNDDYEVEDNYLFEDLTGLITHHADSYLTTELPGEGTYYLQITDAQEHGGGAYCYCLRVAQPQPDFELRMTPSSLFARTGEIVPFNLYVLRKDGFNGSINVIPAEGQSGFKVNGGRIPPGCNHIWMTLETPTQGQSELVSLRLDGVAEINGRTVNRRVVPAEDMMQAFLYRHLVPSQELLVAVKKTPWRASPFKLVSETPIRIQAGDSAIVRVEIPKRAAIRKIDLELVQAPPGLTLGKVTANSADLTFKILTDKNAIKEDVSDNLIVAAFAELKPARRPAKNNSKIQRVPMGLLPAIPIEIRQQPVAAVKADW